MPFAQRLTCTIDDACEVTGLGRTKLYELIGAGLIVLPCSATASEENQTVAIAATVAGRAMGGECLLACRLSPTSTTWPCQLSRLPSAWRESRRGPRRDRAYGRRRPSRPPPARLRPSGTGRLRRGRSRESLRIQLGLWIRCC